MRVGVALLGDPKEKERRRNTNEKQKTELH
jgi:putative ubiquitin-RnfH superfamily antitoxin RatB of RatAB toxin-antitoxin module